jgi:hypothetical protein
MENRAFRLGLAQNGMGIVHERYSKEAFYRTVAESIDSLEIGKGKPGARRRASS